MYGVPISTFSNVSAGITFANNTINQSQGFESSIVQWFIQQQGGRNNFNEPALTAGWSFDNSNKYMFATDGGSFDINGSVNIPVISNIEAYKLKLVVNIILQYQIPICQR